MPEDSDFFPSLTAIPATASQGEFIAALNRVRDEVHQARESRHRHQSRVVHIVDGIRSELMDATDSYAKEIATLNLSMSEIRTALNGGSMGATGINAQIAANNAQISSLVSQVSALTSAVRDCRDESERWQVATDAAIKPLVDAQRDARTAPRWYAHPAAIACMCAAAVSALAKSGPVIGAIVAGAK